MIYISLSDVKTKPILDKITQAEWNDDDVLRSVNEAESYIESFLVKCGYTREQLLKSNLVKKLMINYTWYVILRDIYTMQSPSVGSGQEYNKWRDDVNNILDKIKNKEISLTNELGEEIIPQKNKYDVKTTTKDIKRAVDLGPDWRWSIDEKYYDEEITNR